MPLHSHTVQPLTSHLKNYPSTTSKACKILLEKQGQTHKQHSFMNPYTQTHQCWLTSKNFYQLCMDTGCCLEDLPGAMYGRDGWRERESQENLCCQPDLMIMITFTFRHILGKGMTPLIPSCGLNISTNIQQGWLWH